MDHYQEISLLPDPEFVPALLMNALFGKLHRALAGLGSRRLGISFPEWDPEGPSLGGRLRLHGTREELERLAATGWLAGLWDHVHAKTIRPVPPRAAQVAVRRVQVKSSPERLRRRLAKRKGLGLEEARRLIPDSAGRRLTLPFVALTSASTGQAFRLFIRQDEPQLQAVAGEFNQYGLSATATVPWF